MLGFLNGIGRTPSINQFSLGEIQNLELWLNGNARNTVTQSGDDVSAWADRSSEGNDFDGSTGTPPEYSNAGGYMWTESGAGFNAQSNSAFFNSLHKTPQIAWTLAFQFIYRASTSNQRIMYSGKQPASDHGIGLRVTGSIQKFQLSQVDGSTESRSSTDNIPVLQDGVEYRVILRVSTDGSITWTINGTDYAESITFGTTTSNATSPLTFFNFPDYSSGMQFGTLFKNIAMYSAALSDEDIAKIDAYFAANAIKFTPAQTIIIAGQSNADGRGDVTALSTELSNFYATPDSDLQVFYKPTIRTTANDVDAASFTDDGEFYTLSDNHDDTDKVTHQIIGLQNVTVAASSEIYYGQELNLGYQWAQANTEPLYILKLGVGGSSIGSDWSINSSDGIYAYLRDYIVTPAWKSLILIGKAIDIKAVYWHQGEANVGGTLYENALEDIYDKFNADFYDTPDLIITGSLSSAENDTNGLAFKEQQAIGTSRISNARFLSLDGLDGRTAIPLLDDGIHFTGAGQDTIAEYILDMMGSRDYTPLLEIESSTVAEWDATLYDGFAAADQTKLRNLALAPNDAEYFWDYNLELNGNAFDGVIDNANAAIGFDGNDYLQLGGATDFTNALHKTTGGSDFWIAFEFVYNGGQGNTRLFNTVNAFNGNGIRVYIDTSDNNRVKFSQSNGSSVDSVGLTSGLVAGNTYFVAVSLDNSTGDTRMWLDSTTAETDTLTLATTTANADGALTFGANTTGATNRVGNGTKFIRGAIGNAYLTDVALASIKSEWDGR